MGTFSQIGNQVTNAYGVGNQANQQDKVIRVPSSHQNGIIPNSALINTGNAAILGYANLGNDIQSRAPIENSN